MGALVKGLPTLVNKVNKMFSKWEFKNQPLYMNDLGVDIIPIIK